jgi:hypothetical protein
MNEEVIEALQGSISKWRGIVAGTAEDDGQENCALCQLFMIDPSDHTNCEACPVGIKTGKSLCHDTPYDDYDCGDEDEGKAAAEREVEFLISFLPEGVQPTEEVMGDAS